MKEIFSRITYSTVVTDSPMTQNAHSQLLLEVRRWDGPTLRKYKTGPEEPEGLINTLRGSGEERAIQVFVSSSDSPAGLGAGLAYCVAPPPGHWHQHLSESLSRVQVRLNLRLILSLSLDSLRQQPNINVSPYSNVAFHRVTGKELERISKHNAPRLRCQVQPSPACLYDNESPTVTKAAPLREALLCRIREVRLESLQTLSAIFNPKPADSQCQEKEVMRLTIAARGRT
ncbi:hypothetical protein BC827DRAFT_1157003 [Russula dissimulans]|nr:hypothetical protein BC827DRAFT_1157003 [Russula dissimulans]